MDYEFLFHNLPVHKISREIALSNKFAITFVFYSFILCLLQCLLPLAFSNKVEI